MSITIIDINGEHTATLSIASLNSRMTTVEEEVGKAEELLATVVEIDEEEEEGE